MTWVLLGGGAALLLLLFCMELRRAYYYRDYVRRQRVVNRHGWWRWHWSQDGWTRYCKICKAVQYGGDDYDGGPDENGTIVP